MYTLGIDLGTTFTAAATWRDGHAEIASLGSKAAVIPSVVLLRDDEEVLTGEAANRRGLSEPQRVAREFKRRFGDTTPILLGGAPHSPEALTAKLLRAVIDDVAEREGEQPSRICVCHPANWGPYKRDLLDQVIRLANIDQPVRFTTEPEAAAACYAHQQRVEVGSVVAVYDLGGGTFDATVLRKTPTGFEILGAPEGIERLGGIDFDAAVFHHVAQALDGALDDLDEDDPGVVNAVARLKEECVEAKEALSSDTDTSIPVLLPSLSTEVRLTRAELEAMVRPALYSSIEALRRALRSADVTPEQLHSVLLVGGSSRMPLVAQLVGAELGRPVAVDAHPKHAIAIGAAWLASAAERPEQQAPPVSHHAPRRTVPTGAGHAGAATAGAAGAVAGASAAGGANNAAAEQEARHEQRATRHQSSPSRPPTQPPTESAPQPTQLISTFGTSSGPPTPAGHRGESGQGRSHAEHAGTGVTHGVLNAGHNVGSAGHNVESAGHGNGGDGGGGTALRRIGLVAGGVIVAALVATAAVWAIGGDDGGTGGDADAGTGQNQGQGQNQGADDGGGADEGGTGTQVPPDERCTDAIKSNERWVCLVGARFQGGELVVDYEAEWAGVPPNVNGGFHLHLWGSDGENPPAATMGTHAPDRGTWVIKDDQPAVLTAQQVANVIGDNPKVCARIANGSHELVPDNDGGYATGNCVPIER
ncbi:Hsp70 family protein [Haloechinothrix salitolerans]|uniref:Hsp70 family protein n=1 Tax=Haloechinothrix salitolerans TaxID=926830 RepID=A0ABW2C001_9PSEU